MLRNMPIMEVLLINLLLGTVWHFATFFICISVTPKMFDANKKMYHPCKWEKNGKFYSDHLKINKWKDFLPQHVGKDGFSKDHIDDLSIEYLDEFIMETCRGEWNHTMNCAFAVVLFVIDDFWIALLLCVCLWAGNMPFAVIQRYNRFRLQKVKQTILKKQERNKRRLAKTININAPAPATSVEAADDTSAAQTVHEG